MTNKIEISRALAARRTIQFALSQLEICQYQAFQDCECETCLECGKMPDECTGTECAKTCQCSTCEHCMNEWVMEELRALLAKADGTLTDEGTMPDVQQHGEPVAWQAFSPSIGPNGHWLFCSDQEEAENMKGRGFAIRELYAEQPAPASQYTLTAEQFEAIEALLKDSPASQNVALQDLLARAGRWAEPVAVVLPFADKVISKLQRFVECTDDGQGADIGRHWFDILTHLGLLNRVQRSPGLWEMTQQGEDCLEAAATLNTPL